MVDRATIERQFEEIGVTITDPSVIDKCLDLCVQCDVDPETFLPLWQQFVESQSADSKHGDEQPTVEMLEKMSRWARSKHNEDESLNNLSDSDCESSELLKTYGITKPMIQQVKRQRSPDELDSSIVQKRKKLASKIPLSPASNKDSTATQSGNTQSDVRGVSLLQFNKSVNDWKTKNPRQVSIKKTDDPHVPPRARYMFELITKKSAILQKVCREFGRELCKHWSKTDDDKKIAITANVRKQSQTTFRTWGKIFSNDREPLNNQTLLLEGCKSYSQITNESVTMRIDLSQLDSYSIFPGQMLAVEGTNPTGNVLAARAVLSSRLLEPAAKPMIDERLHIVVGTGWFTKSNVLDYEPLDRLLERVCEIEPHVLIMIGPFVPASHPEIVKPTIDESFQDLFERIVEKIMGTVKGKCTQVVLIPSPDDIHHDSIYPTPEFYLPESMRAPNLHLMTDPSMLDIDGLVIGATSTDIVCHLSRAEIHRKASKDEDRPLQLVNHVLSQACFYPLYPAAKGSKVDTGLWADYAFMHQRPHILILPSDLRHFCKWTQDCVVINPSRLNRQTYARIIVEPSLDGSWKSEMVNCEILKV